MIRPLTSDTLDEFTLTLSRWLFLAGAVAVSALVLRVGPATVGDLLLGASLLTLFQARPRHWLPTGWPVSPVVGALLLVVAGSAPAVVGSAHPAESLLVVLRLVFLAAVVPWQMSTLFRTEASVQRVFWATGLGAAANGVATVVQFTLGVSIPGAAVSSADRFSGLTGHVSDTGAITALGTVIGFGLLGRQPWKWRDLAAVAVLVLSLIGLILSGSVAGMLSAVLGLALLTVTGAVRRSKSLLALGAAAVGGATGAFIISQTRFGLSPTERLLQVLGMKQSHWGTNTSASRWETIERGWTHFAAHPWSGAGLDEESAPVLLSLGVHNFVVGILYAGGLVFALGVLWLVVLPLARALAVRRVSTLAASALTVAMSAILFAGTAPGYYNRYFWIPLALCSAVAAASLRGRGVPGASSAETVPLIATPPPSPPPGDDPVRFPGSGPSLPPRGPGR